HPGARGRHHRRQHAAGLRQGDPRRHREVGEGDQGRRHQALGYVSGSLNMRPSRILPFDTDWIGVGPAQLVDLRGIVPVALQNLGTFVDLSPCGSTIGCSARPRAHKGGVMPKRNYLCIQRSSPGKGRGEKPSPAGMQEMFAKFNAWKEKYKEKIVDM